MNGYLTNAPKTKKSSKTGRRTDRAKEKKVESGKVDMTPINGNIPPRITCLTDRDVRCR